RYVLDTTGNVGVIDTLLNKVTGCTIGLVGIGSGELTIDPVHLVEREISVIGCHAFADELPEALALLHAQADRFQGIIGDRITLDQTVAAYGVISSGKATAIKTLIEVSGA
ncbi:MAG: dehydrogenase, partial [Hyphomicrobiales bacterium]